MSIFEKVTRFNDIDLSIPECKTAQSAGYDLTVAEDIVLPPYREQLAVMRGSSKNRAWTLDEVASKTKELKTKPALVSTGMKCKLQEGQYLELMVRSSTPLKYWIILANAPGIIDADYYNNADNEGEIFMQLINLSPWPIQLHRGDCICQAIVKEYIKGTDTNNKVREGGFGSTSEKRTTKPKVLIKKDPENWGEKVESLDEVIKE